MLQLVLASALIVNADFIQYYKRPAEEMTAACAAAYVDRMAEGGKVTHFFMNPASQRANFESAHWEPIWKGLDEPDSQGAVSNVWAVNSKLCHDRGFDVYRVWIGRCREKGISPWISMRMNDVHNVHIKDFFATSTHWRTHPELRRNPKVDPVKNGWDWINVAYDYSKPDVRAYRLAQFRELVDRYDADGFELDWMRFWAHLPPGRERLDAHFLADFMRDCRAYLDAKAKERGHPIRMSVRVPYGRKPAFELGFDPETWVKERLVDLVVVGNFWMTIDYATDFAEWKTVLTALNPDVKVVPSADCSLAGAPFYRGGQPVRADIPALRGWCDLLYSLGADDVYLFNADRGTKITAKTTAEENAAAVAYENAVYGGDLSAAAVREAPRRYVCTFHDCILSWGSDGCQLPKDLKGGCALTVNVGTPTCESAAVVLGFDAEPPAGLAVTLNGVAALESGVPETDAARFGKSKAARRFAFPPSAVRTGANAVAVGPVDTAVKIRWCEVELK